MFTLILFILLFEPPPKTQNIFVILLSVNRDIPQLKKLRVACLFKYFNGRPVKIKAKQKIKQNEKTIYNYIIYKDCNKLK